MTRTEDTTTPSPAEPATPDSSPTPAPARVVVNGESQRSGTWGVLAWLVVLLLAVAGVVLSASLWLRTNGAQDEMGRRVADLTSAQSQSEAQSEAMQTQVRELQSRLSSSEARLSELALQRAQLEELVRGLSRSRDDSLVLDLESSVSMAVLQSQMTGSVSPMVSALQSGMDRLVRAAQARLSPVQVAMEQDLHAIQSAEVADVPRIVGTLSDVVRDLSNLPLGVAPPERPSAVLNQISTPEAAPAADKSASAWQRAVAWVQWKLGSWAHAAGQELNGLVRVRRMAQNEVAVLMPEQQAMLAAQLKLRLLGARVAVLNGQTAIARGDLLAVSEEINRYAQLETPVVQTMLKTLTELSDELARSALPKPEQTLRALAAVGNP